MELAHDPNQLGRPFAGSLVAHALLIAILLYSGFWTRHNNWGSPHASSGSVGVTMVKTIPIPRREGPVNPLANDTKSVVPQEPTPAKVQKRVEAPPKDAIPLSTKLEKPKKPRQELIPAFRPPIQYKTNQVYSHTPQATTSAMFGMQGSGGIDIGPASVLGTQYGAYVDLMKQQIAQHWNTADVRALPSQKCAVTFTIARNGMVSNVQISQPSGNYLLDTSAKRALLDSNPLPTLPREFPRNEVTVELWFQLNQ